MFLTDVEWTPEQNRLATLRWKRRKGGQLRVKGMEPWPLTYSRKSEPVVSGPGFRLSVINLATRISIEPSHLPWSEILFCAAFEILMEEGSD